MEGPGPGRCFCLSKGRDATQLNAQPAPSALREQLQTLRPVALSKRAKAGGVGDELVEEALDSADPKLALIELIVEHSGGGERDAALLSELRGMRLKALKLRLDRVSWRHTFSVPRKDRRRINVGEGKAHTLSLLRRVKKGPPSQKEGRLCS